MKFQFLKSLLLALALTLIPLSSKAASDIVVIVNEKNPLSSIKISELDNFFMKKTRVWPNMDVVRIFDHRDENPNRKLFLKKYVEKTSREIELYWIGEKIYTGNIAPIQITSDSMMVAMVSRFPGGIGYVSKSFKLPKTVKTIKIIKD